MAYCPNCKHSFRGKLCPNCGGPPALTPAQINDALKVHTLVDLGGLIGILFATWRYPLLDQDPVLAAALFLFVVPILTYLFLAIRKRAAAHLGLLKRLFAWSAGALVALVLFVAINGGLDNHPSEMRPSVVLGKSASRGRGGTYYTIYISPSWRAGKDTEKLPVNGQTYSAVYKGESVVIEVHQGALGLSWFSSVSPR